MQLTEETVEELTGTGELRCQSRHEDPSDPACTVVATHTLAFHEWDTLTWEPV